MFWKVNYIIDDGYAWHKQVCIIAAENGHKANEIFHNEVKNKLSEKYNGNRIVLDEYTVITKCDNNIVLYNSWKM